MIIAIFLAALTLTAYALIDGYLGGNALKLPRLAKAFHFAYGLDMGAWAQQYRAFIICFHTGECADRYEKIYLNASETTAAKNYVNHGNDNLGLIFERIGNSTAVLDAVISGPAYDSGIRRGDTVSKVASDQNATWMTLRVLGKNCSCIFEVNVTPTNKTVYGALLGDDIGYIRVFTLAGMDTPTQFQKALEDLKLTRIRGLIIDLRHTPGGLLRNVINISGMLLPEGTVIARIIPSRGEGYLLASSGAPNVSLPMVVLVNNRTGSSAEILSATLSQGDYAISVGERTYGKSTMYSLVELGDGSSVMLPAGYYLTPDGENLSGVGFQPDFGVDEGIPESEDGYIKTAIRLLANMTRQ